MGWDLSLAETMIMEIFVFLSVCGNSFEYIAGVGLRSYLV